MLNNKEISLKVPATTGNVGSGFDCIGLAVDVWNSLLISFNSDNLVIENKGVSKDAYDSIKVKDDFYTVREVQKGLDGEVLEVSIQKT